MEIECVAQEKELMDLDIAKAVSGLRANLNSIKTPATKKHHPAIGEAGVEFNLKDLLGVS